jgi:hypothetical protein
MKKIMVMILPVLMVLAAATAILSHEAGEGKEAGWMADRDGMMKMCPFCMKGAKVEVKNTADGADIVITTSEKKDVKEIQDRADKMIKMHKEMMEGNMEKGGMMMGGMHGGYGHRVFWIISMLLVYILMILLIILLIFKIRVLGKQLKQ